MSASALSRAGRGKGEGERVLGPDGSSLLKAGWYDVPVARAVKCGGSRVALGIEARLCGTLR